MDEKIESLFELAGNSNRYQYRLSLLTFLIWVNLNILAVSLGLLEKPPEIQYYDSVRNETIQSSLNSTICEWKNNYTFTKNYTHSIITSFNHDCDPIWIGLLGTSTFLGNLIGCFIFQYLVEKLGRKKTILVNSIPFLLSIITIIFSPDYVTLVVCFFFSELFCVNIVYTTYLISCEVASSKKRSTFGSFINSAFGICGMLYTIYYKYVGNWRHVFAIAFGSNIIFIIAFILSSYESPRFYLVKKDFDKFIEALKNIARVNKRQDIFEEKLADKDSEYRQAYDFIKAHFDKTNHNRPTLNDKKITQIKQDNVMDSQESSKTEIGINTLMKESENSPNLNASKSEKFSDDFVSNKLKQHEIKEDGSSINFILDKTNHKKKRFTILDFFRYASIRYKFLSLCFIWLTSSGSYYGLSINIKNLSGDVYFNGIVNYSFEIVIYIISGYLINQKIFGRKKTMIVYYVIANIGLTLYVFVSLDQAVTNLVLFIVRLCLAANYIILFTYTLEIYPSPARARGFGINNAVSKLTPVIFPVLMEVLPNIIFYIYLLLNLICLIILIVAIPETHGKPLKETIEEEEDDFEKSRKDFNSGIEDKEKPLIDPISSF